MKRVSASGSGSQPGPSGTATPTSSLQEEGVTAREDSADSGAGPASAYAAGESGPTAEPPKEPQWPAESSRRVIRGGKNFWKFLNFRKLNGLVSSSLLQRHWHVQNHVDSMPPRIDEAPSFVIPPRKANSILRDDFYCATPTVCLPLSLSVTSPLALTFSPYD